MHDLWNSPEGSRTHRPIICQSEGWFNHMEDGLIQGGFTETGRQRPVDKDGQEEEDNRRIEEDLPHGRELHFLEIGRIL